MKKAVMAAGALTVCMNAWALTPGTHWEYFGAAGPENWAKLTPEFHSCSGQNQSPVNLDGFIEAELAPLKVDYAAGASEAANNGHTVQVSYEPGSTLELDGTSFQLIQFHFHMPSENQFKGRSYPLEGHLVHADEKGNLAVVAVMFEEGERNAMLANLWARRPSKARNSRSHRARTSATYCPPILITTVSMVRSPLHPAPKAFAGWCSSSPSWRRTSRSRH